MGQVIDLPKLPYGSSSWRVNTECHVCGANAARRILKRRVRSHQEQLGSAVAVSIVIRCQNCGIRGHHKVRIDGNTVHPPRHAGVSE